ncbi:RsfA family transcriptional regulator [Bacillus sp. UMB0728]|uniref:RsfA family transcriptional regulator n=1 Tax=Bacillus sp. UMB0728 TaxID=2066052 RepID=UPI000C75EDCF|nr:RsfA family transcriptional regulator [Bacillus sp. UMB0728]PLR70577.1 RsfA family transcriptional regulator [Bacillus sp. UMB0728]
MKNSRKDAWTNDEDTILAREVLRQIEEGGTQLDAFQVVGKLLSRTASACGFRWNSTVRKTYEEAIAAAKKRKNDRRKKDSGPIDAIDMRVMIESIKLLYSFAEGEDPRVTDLKKVKNKLENENQQLVSKIKTLQEKFEEISAIFKS